MEFQKSIISIHPCVNFDILLLLHLGNANKKKTFLKIRSQI